MVITTLYHGNVKTFWAISFVISWKLSLVYCWKYFVNSYLKANKKAYQASVSATEFLNNKKSRTLFEIFLHLCTSWPSSYTKDHVSYPKLGADIYGKLLVPK